MEGIHWARCGTWGQRDSARYLDILRTQEPSRNMGNFRRTETGHCLCCFVYGGLVFPAVHPRAGQALG